MITSANKSFHGLAGAIVATRPASPALINQMAQAARRGLCTSLNVNIGMSLKETPRRSRRNTPTMPRCACACICASGLNGEIWGQHLADARNSPASTVNVSQDSDEAMAVAITFQRGTLRKVRTRL